MISSSIHMTINANMLTLTLYGCHAGGVDECYVQLQRYTTCSRFRNSTGSGPLQCCYIVMWFVVAESPTCIHILSLTTDALLLDMTYHIYSPNLCLRACSVTPTYHSCIVLCYLHIQLHSTYGLHLKPTQQTTTDYYNTHSSIQQSPVTLPIKLYQLYSNTTSSYY